MVMTKVKGGLESMLSGKFGWIFRTKLTPCPALNDLFFLGFSTCLV